MEVKVMRNILGANDEIAASNRELFRAKNICVVNLMGSPGSGKTTLLEKTLEKISGKVSVAVIEGDLFTARDAERIERLGVPVVQISIPLRYMHSAVETIDLDDVAATSALIAAVVETLPAVPEFGFRL